MFAHVVGLFSPLLNNLFSISFLLLLTTLHYINFSSSLYFWGSGFFFRPLRCSMLLIHIIFFHNACVHTYSYYYTSHTGFQCNHWCSYRFHPQDCRCLHSIFHCIDPKRRLPWVSHIGVQCNHWCSDRSHPPHCRCLHSCRGLDCKLSWVLLSEFHSWNQSIHRCSNSFHRPHCRCLHSCRGLDCKLSWVLHLPLEFDSQDPSIPHNRPRRWHNIALLHPCNALQIDLCRFSSWSCKSPFSFLPGQHQVPSLLR